MHSHQPPANFEAATAAHARARRVLIRDLVEVVASTRLGVVLYLSTPVDELGAALHGDVWGCRGGDVGLAADYRDLREALERRTVGD
jgi:hypothetical protein